MQNPSNQSVPATTAAATATASPNAASTVSNQYIDTDNERKTDASSTASFVTPDTTSPEEVLGALKLQSVASCDSLSSHDSSSVVSPETALDHINRLNQTSLHLSQLERARKEQEEEGVIHGHIHNFSGFTYIHGHIHTNEASAGDCGTSSSACNNTNAAPVDQAKKPDTQHSHHCHPNDSHASQFSDCQHFEFLNCHDNLDKGNLIIEDLDLKCEEDEHCKPKIMEICCETAHPLLPSQAADTVTTPLANRDQRIPQFQKNLPTCVTNAVLPKAGPFARMSQLPADTAKLQQCEQNGNGSGVDIDCGLDTCGFDDLCRFCDELGLPYPDDFSQQQQQQQQQQLPIGSSQQHSFGVKRTRDSRSDTLTAQPVLPVHQHAHDHDHDHDISHSHHLHHHNHDHSHSQNHHHHHIQLHDHHSHHSHNAAANKKQCTEASAHGGSNDLINFSWNFKNMPKACEWNNCGDILENPIQLQHHIMENHLIALPQTNNTSKAAEQDDNDGYLCEWKDCEYLGEDLFQLVNHINCTHNTQKEFNAGNQLAILNSLDGQPPLLPQGVPLLPGQNFDEAPRLNSDDGGETRCQWHIPGQPVCNIQFSNSEDLTRHILEDHVGSGKSLYICYWAGCERQHREFPQRQKIIRHLHVHTKHKPFLCKVCNHRFITEGILEQHMRTHSGEKPFVCKVCGKAFARSSSLSIHNRVHTGEKPLQCKYPGCDKRFSESSNLTKHMRTHTKGWECEKCGKTFAKSKQLELHAGKCNGLRDSSRQAEVALSNEPLNMHTRSGSSVSASSSASNSSAHLNHMVPGNYQEDRVSTLSASSNESLEAFNKVFKITAPTVATNAGPQSYQQAQGQNFQVPTQMSSQFEQFQQQQQQQQQPYQNQMYQGNGQQQFAVQSESQAQGQGMFHIGDVNDVNGQMNH
ncbi:hypothetical protein WICPIJ_003765 [Wickerhamomyces pijperi]|uniref:C2H2-type domain-containing protein n=1 Tax=Wickerhamomyces pijperi TaxID=599730 RepID=A0A9P8TNF6_WICPI|nr:hypothetical protein WICPIJ_003765 [Wickerhamomyces pijperi]